MAKTEISIPNVVEKFISQLREKKGFKTIAETVEYMLPIAASRINATTKYARDHKPAAKPRKAKAPAKKAAPKKAAKAKGPLARKQASKAKPPRVRKAKAPAPAEVKPATITSLGAPEPVLD